jgi:hypothetical protein
MAGDSSSAVYVRVAAVAVRQWGFPSLRAPRESFPLRLGRAPTNLSSRAFIGVYDRGPLTTKVVDRLRLGHFEER